MFREALTYSIRADEESLLAGTILALALGVLLRLGVLAVLAVVPLVLLAGYALAVVRTTAEGVADPPKFSEFRALTADGVRALAVAVGYLLVPSVLLAVTVGGRLFGGSPATDSALLVFGGGTVVLFVSLALAYLLPAALVGVARRRTLRAAFDFGALGRTAFDGGYFVAWVSALVIAGVAGAGLGALAALGRPGEVVALGCSFYAVVAVARLMGRAAR